MSLYVYRCRVCVSDIEVEHPMSADPLVLCDECGSARHRVPQSAGVVLKGDGFYKTEGRHG